MSDKIHNYEMPTDDELEKFPALKEAWDEYLVIRQLALGDKGVIFERKFINPANWSVYSDY